MLRKLAYGTAIAALLSAGSAQALIVDDFTVGLTGGTTGAGNGACYVEGGCVLLLTTPGSSVTSISTGSTANIIGGDRELVLTHTGGAGAVIASVSSAQDSFSHSNGSGVSGISLLRWDGAGNGGGLDFDLDDGVGAAGYDITEGGTLSGLSIKILDADLTNSTMQFRLYNNAGTFVQLAVNPPSGASVFDIDYATIVGVDLTAITAIELEAIGGDAFDVTIDFIESRVLPEPATLALFGLGLVGVAAMRRRVKA